MSYRRKQTQDETEWRSWLKQHASLVQETGLPDIVLQDDDHWYDFLDHGILDHHEDPTHFNVDQLSVRQKSALLRLLLTWPTFLSTIVGHNLMIAMIEAVERRYPR